MSKRRGLCVTCVTPAAGGGACVLHVCHAGSRRRGWCVTCVSPDERLCGGHDGAGGAVVGLQPHLRPVHQTEHQTVQSTRRCRWRGGVNGDTRGFNGDARGVNVDARGVNVDARGVNVER
eukprot:1184822-Prorocentrum_minimum.AAC.3